MYSDLTITEEFNQPNTPSFKLPLHTIHAYSCYRKAKAEVVQLKGERVVAEAKAVAAKAKENWKATEMDVAKATVRYRISYF